MSNGGGVAASNDRGLPEIPVDEIRFAGEKGSAQEYAPFLIAPNPLTGATDHYLVLNCGHTFHENECSTRNYQLFARLGDWALVPVLPEAENWRFANLNLDDSPE